MMSTSALLLFILLCKDHAIAAAACAWTRKRHITTAVSNDIVNTVEMPKGAEFGCADVTIILQQQYWHLGQAIAM